MQEKTRKSVTINLLKESVDNIIESENLSETRSRQTWRPRQETRNQNKMEK